jgi:hypothetical protein
VAGRINQSGLLLALAVLAACSTADLPAGKRGAPFLLTDTGSHEFVLRELEREGVPYKLDDRGFVQYLLKDQSKVHGIERRAIYGEELRQDIWESAILVDDLTRAAYEQAFASAGIPYRITSRGGVTEIEWNQLHGPEVDVLRQRVDFSIMDKVISNAIGT